MWNWQRLSVLTSTLMVIMTWLAASQQQCRRWCRQLRSRFVCCFHHFVTVVLSVFWWIEMHYKQYFLWTMVHILLYIVMASEYHCKGSSTFRTGGGCRKDETSPLVGVTAYAVHTFDMKKNKWFLRHLFYFISDVCTSNTHAHTHTHSNLFYLVVVSDGLLLQHLWLPILAFEFLFY